MVQVFSPSPRAMQAGQIGQSIGQGIGLYGQRQQMQQQQGQLAQALFGDQAQQFASLPMQEQLRVADFLQNQQKFSQTNQQNQQSLAAQQNLAKQLFPENAENFGQLPPQQQIALAKLFKQQKDSDLKEKVIGSLFGGQPQGEDQQQAQPKESELLSDAQIAAIATVDPNLAKIFQMQKDTALKEARANRKEAEKKEEAKKPIETAQRSFNSMAKLLKKGNLGLGSGILSSAIGGDRAKDVAQFTSATGGLEALLVDMVSRGTLSNARFKYITETLLPKPGDRDKEIEGKMIALADLLGLDSTELNQKKSVSSVGKKQDKESLEDIWK
jgi:hypothetical protein